MPEKKCRTSIPSELTERAQWIAWALKPREIRTRAGVIRQLHAVPFLPDPKRVIPLRNPYDPNKWHRYCPTQFAVSQNPHLDGPAYVNPTGVEDETYVMVVLHNAVDSRSQTIAPWALPYITLGETYAEYGYAPNSIVMLFRGRRLREPIRLGSVYISTPPFLALTGRKLAAARYEIRHVNAKIRPGDRESRYERILRIAKESYERYQQRRQRHRENTEAILGAIVTHTGPMQTLATNIYAAKCPQGKGVLIAHRRANTIHLGCIEGPQVPLETLIRELELQEYADRIQELDPTLLPHYQSLAGRLLPKANLTFQPVRGYPLRLIRQYQENLRRAGTVPEVLADTPITYEDLRLVSAGYNPTTGGVVLPFHGTDNAILYAEERYKTPGGRIRFNVLTPNHPKPSWIPPGFTSRTEALLITEGTLDALLLNGLLSGQGVAVMGIPSLYHDPVREFLAELPKLDAYLYPGPGEPEERKAAARRWARVVAELGHRPLLLPLLRTPDLSGGEQGVSPLRYAILRSRNELAEAIEAAAEDASSMLQEV